MRSDPHEFIMHHPVFRRHIVQSSVLKLFFAHGTLFLTARHRRGMIVEGGSARVESGTRACAGAENESCEYCILHIS